MIGEKRDQYILNTIRERVLSYKTATNVWEKHCEATDFRMGAENSRLYRVKHAEALALAEMMVVHEALVFRPINCVMCGNGTEKENKVCPACEDHIDRCPF